MPEQLDDKKKPFWYIRLPKTAFEGDVAGADIVDWYQKLFDNATTFASILASAMFSVTVSELKVQNETDVRRQSAIGAVLFVFLVLLCQAFSLLLKFHGRLVAREYNNKNVWFRGGIAIVSLAFQQLLLVGTLYFCQVLRAYVPGVGRKAYRTTLALIIISSVFWLSTVFVEGRSQWKKWWDISGIWVSPEQAEVTSKMRDRKAYTRDRKDTPAIADADAGPRVALAEADPDEARLEEART